MLARPLGTRVILDVASGLPLVSGFQISQVHTSADMLGYCAFGRGQPERAERRLSEAVPVYAAPDQDVCGVDM